MCDCLPPADTDGPHELPEVRHFPTSCPYPTQDVVRLDPDLAPHADHLKYRWRRFLETKAAIEAAEGSLANFALVRFICVWRGL